MGRIIGGFGALASATLVAQAIGFATLTIAARRLGPDDLGSFSFALNLVGYFAIPANFGITALAIRDVARAPERARRIAGEVFALQAALVALPYAVLVVLAPVLGADDTSQRLLPVVGLTFVIDALSLQWVLYATHRFGWLAVSRVVGGVAQGLLVLLLVRAGEDGAERLAWATVAGVAVTSAATLVPALRGVGRPRLGVSLRPLLRRFRLGVPLGVAAVMISIYYSIDSVMLGYLESSASVGQYAVAYRIPLAILAIGALWGSVLYPHASDVFPRDPRRLARELGQFASLCAAVALPLAVGAVFVGGDLMPELFGERFSPAGTPFVLLMCAAALVLVTINYGTAAIAIGDERRYAVAVTLGALANVLINLVAIPAFGMTGAASATIAAELVVFVAVVVRVRRLLGPVWPSRNRLARIGLATAVMAAVLVALPGDLAATLRAAIGGGVYVAACAALGVVRPAELAAVLRREPSEVVGAASPAGSPPG